MRQNIFTALALSGLILLSSPVAAQEFADDLSDFQTWGNITATGNFGFVNPDNPTLKKVLWWAEGQGRFWRQFKQVFSSPDTTRPGLQD